jgi:hypothetical protein
MGRVRVLAEDYVLGSGRAKRLMAAALALAKYRAMIPANLARLTKYSPSYFTDWKAGRRTINRAQVIAVCKAIGAKENELLAHAFRGIVVADQSEETPRRPSKPD